ncbi:GIY-YIG nuclease family protein [Nocardia sp. SC052]|uniref:GIY-YIG nuclease family protein n=1 Tax=Nocardia sichangensis TaxID=3385975 RepID=UPI00399FA078
MTREEILAEIRRTAEANGGKPLGREQLERVTGIKEYDWQKFWPRISEAQREAGFEPNRFILEGHDRTFLMESAIALIRELKRFPTRAEMRIKRRADPSFPNDSAYTRRFGTRDNFIAQISQYCDGKKGYDDVVEILEATPRKVEVDAIRDDRDISAAIGEVYLFKSGKYFKIGMTNNMVRRGNELRIQLPERIDLVHSIKTDDPSGIENYWHRRFNEKRLNGEWFNLNPADVRAFKRWRKIY